MQINISHATLKYTHRFRHPLEVPDKICLQPNSAEQTIHMQGHEVSVVVPLLNEQDNVKPQHLVQDSLTHEAESSSQLMPTSKMTSRTFLK